MGWEGSRVFRIIFWFIFLIFWYFFIFRIISWEFLLIFLFLYRCTDKECFFDNSCRCCSLHLKSMAIMIIHVQMDVPVHSVNFPHEYSAVYAVWALPPSDINGDMPMGGGRERLCIQFHFMICVVHIRATYSWGDFNCHRISTPSYSVLKT